LVEPCPVHRRLDGANPFTTRKSASSCKGKRAAPAKSRTDRTSLRHVKESIVWPEQLLTGVLHIVKWLLLEYSVNCPTDATLACREDATAASVQAVSKEPYDEDMKRKYAKHLKTSERQAISLQLRQWA
jgi:hypothetical protein